MVAAKFDRMRLRQHLGGSGGGGGGGGGGGSSGGGGSESASGPAEERPLTVFDIGAFSKSAALAGREVRTHKACYGCTAGAGSSCGGALL